MKKKKKKPSGIYEAYVNKTRKNFPLTGLKGYAFGCLLHLKKSKKGGK